MNKQHTLDLFHKLLCVLSFFLLFFACEQVQFSEVMTEQGCVEQTIFTPSSHGTGVGPSFHNGEIGLAITSIDVPEIYAVVFHCQHGKFVIQGGSEKYKVLWSKLKSGDLVTISYREVYMVDLKAKTKRLIKYDFMDANANKRDLTHGNNK